MIIIASLTIFLLYIIFPWKHLSEHKLSKSRKLLFFAHRGIHNNTYENSIKSFNNAFDLHADGIELDVQYTYDDKIVIHHDPFIQTDSKKIIICEQSYNNINRILVDDKYHISRIPLLVDLLLILPDKVFINIEIKANGSNVLDIVTDIIDFAHSYSLHDRLMVSSFNPKFLKQIKAQDKNIYTGLLIERDFKVFNINISFFSSFINFISMIYSKPDAINPEINYLNLYMKYIIKIYGLSIFPYTINSLKDLNKAESLFVNGFFSDNKKFINQCKQN